MQEKIKQIKITANANEFKERCNGNKKKHKTTYDWYIMYFLFTLFTRNDHLEMPRSPFHARSTEQVGLEKKCKKRYQTPF